MNKIHLIYDTIHKINNNIQIGETSEVLNIIVKGRILDKQYKTVYEIVSNHLVAIGIDGTRYIINNQGNIEMEWAYNRLDNKDEIYIGKYLDNLGILTKDIVIMEVITSSDSSRFCISKERGIPRMVSLRVIDSDKLNGVYIYTLYNSDTDKSIDSLIVNNKTEIKFISDTGYVNQVTVINERLRYICKYDNRYEQISSGIYNRNKLITLTDTYYEVNDNLIVVYLNDCTHTLGIIHNNRLKNKAYSFVAEKYGILYVQDKHTGKWGLYDTDSLKGLKGVKNVRISIIKDYSFNILELEYYVNDIKLNTTLYNVLRVY